MKKPAVVTAGTIVETSVLPSDQTFPGVAVCPVHAREILRPILEGQEKKRSHSAGRDANHDTAEFFGSGIPHRRYRHVTVNKRANEQASESEGNPAYGAYTLLESAARALFVFLPHAPDENGNQYEHRQNSQCPQNELRVHFPLL